ncbi:MAG TPA: glycosyl hydrolase, partial [Ktedonobacteraceae bacterium]|nr:glycosyl hydrolase [Ktedonobacteraceae bacterium]
MIKLYIAIDEVLVVVSQQKDAWKVVSHLVGSQPQCLAVDPLHPEQVYCGTFDQGLWRSRNAGVSWEHMS